MSEILGNGITIPKSIQPPIVLAEFCALSSQATNASYSTYTFTDDYDYVMVLFDGHDSDVNGDNLYKVYSVYPGTANIGSLRNNIANEWESCTRKFPSGTGVSPMSYANPIDQNKDQYWGSNYYAYCYSRISYKTNVKRGDVAHIFYFSYLRAVATVIGIK